MKEKTKILIKQEIMPNYFWHIISLSNVFDKENSRYTKQYSEYLSTSIDIIAKNKKLFRWGNGITSLYSLMLFFIPFQNRISPTEYFTYLDNITNAIEQNELFNYIKSISKNVNISQVYQVVVNDNDLKIFDSIKKVLLDNFKIFEHLFYNQIELILMNSKHEFLNLLDDSIISEWEKQLNIKFGHDQFTIVQTLANAEDQLPNANNLSENRNNIGFSLENIIETIDLFYHEVGIFLLLPTIKNIWSDETIDTEFIGSLNIKYQAIESYVEYIKGKMGFQTNIWNSKMENGVLMEMEWFLDFYKNNCTNDDERNIRMAIKEYEKIKST